MMNWKLFRRKHSLSIFLSAREDLNQLKCPKDRRGGALNKKRIMVGIN
jgi:hypothetical protein